MAKWKRHRTADQDERAVWIRLLLLALLFLGGLILGQVLAGKVSDPTAAELTKYLDGYFSLENQGNASAGTVASALVIYFRYPLLAVLLGFASVGVVLLPVLTVAYGFFLSFSVCCFTAAFGSNGVLLALSVFGLRCLVTLPCYFALAAPSLNNAVALAALSVGGGKRTARPVYGKSWWLRCGVSACVLLAGVTAELFLSPYLLNLVLTRIFGT